MFLLQGFGLGGVIATFGLVLDLIGFVLFLIFVVVSSLILLTRQTRSPTPRVESSWVRLFWGDGARSVLAHSVTLCPFEPCRCVRGGLLLVTVPVV